MHQFADSIGNGARPRVVSLGCGFPLGETAGPDRLRMPSGIVPGNQRSLGVNHDEQIVRVLEPVLQDRDDVGQLGYPDDRLRGRTEQLFVEHDAGGSRDHRAPAAAYRRGQFHHGVLDLADDRFVRALLD